MQNYCNSVGKSRTSTHNYRYARLDKVVSIRDIGCHRMGSEGHVVVLEEELRSGGQKFYGKLRLR